MFQSLRQHRWNKFQGPRDEPDADPVWFGKRHFSFQIGLAAQGPGIASANDSQPTRAGHSRREFAASDQFHWCAEYRMLDLKTIRETCSDHSETVTLHQPRSRSLSNRDRPWKGIGGLRCGTR